MSPDRGLHSGADEQGCGVACIARAVLGDCIYLILAEHHAARGGVGEGRLGQTFGYCSAFGTADDLVCDTVGIVVAARFAAGRSCPCDGSGLAAGSGGDSQVTDLAGNVDAAPYADISAYALASEVVVAEEGHLMRAVGEGDGVRRAAAACSKTRESLIEGAVDVYLDLQFSRQGAAVVVTRGDVEVERHLIAASGGILHGHAADCFGSLGMAVHEEERREYFAVDEFLDGSAHTGGGIKLKQIRGVGALLILIDGIAHRSPVKFAGAIVECKTGICGVDHPSDFTHEGGLAGALVYLVEVRAALGGVVCHAVHFALGAEGYGRDVKRSVDFRHVSEIARLEVDRTDSEAFFIAVGTVGVHRRCGVVIGHGIGIGECGGIVARHAHGLPGAGVDLVEGVGDFILYGSLDTVDVVEISVVVCTSAGNHTVARIDAVHCELIGLTVAGE